MRKLIFTLPLIFIAFSSHGQNTDKFTGSLLWKVSGNGLESPSYIFGTHHLAEISFAQNYPGLTEALAASRQVAGEIVMSEMGTMQNSMMMHAVMPSGTTYQTLLSEEECRRLNDLLVEHLGGGLEQLGHFKPSMVSYILSIRQMAEAMPELNLLTHVSIDQYLQEEATGEGKKVMGLETAEDQIRALFYSEPLEVQAQSLICALSNMESSRESIRKLNEMYASGDLYGAYAMAFEDTENPCPFTEELSKALCKTRNDKWIEQLPGIFADAPTLVAVGMLHLCGEEGILFQLDRLGYVIEAVR